MVHSLAWADARPKESKGNMGSGLDNLYSPWECKTSAKSRTGLRGVAILLPDRSATMEAEFCCGTAYMDWDVPVVAWPV